MVFSGILLNTNKNKITTLNPSEPLNYLDPTMYSRNEQTFQYSGTFIMSMKDASWDNTAPLSSGYDNNSNITYTITRSSSEGITTVYVAYHYTNTFDPTSNTTVPGLRLRNKSYYNDMLSNELTIIQFGYIPLDTESYQLFEPEGLTISATDVPFIQKNTNLGGLYQRGQSMPKENYEWIGRLDTTNCIILGACIYRAYYNNTNLNGWNINNNVSMHYLDAAYNALEKMAELGYILSNYNDQNFPNHPELQTYRNMHPHISTNGVTRYGGANIVEDCNSILAYNSVWNNGRDPHIPNLLSWVFCNKNQTLKTTFFANSVANIRFTEPFLLASQVTPLSNNSVWNNGFEPGEYWSLKDHKWSFAMCINWTNIFQNTAFSGDFAGIRSPGTKYCLSAFRYCRYFDSDLTDMISSWQNTGIQIKNMISNSGLSVENYSKFLIAIYNSYANNNLRFNYNNFEWSIDQYYNNSASSARNALETTFPNKIIDLGLLQ
jgi:hypothetical protein